MCFFFKPKTRQDKTNLVVSLTLYEIQNSSAPKVHVWYSSRGGYHTTKITLREDKTSHEVGSER